MPARRSKRWQRQKDSHLVTSYPKRARCGFCRRDVFSGYASGIHTLYDIYELTQVGELEALLRGLRTYHANHPNFDRRTAFMIRNYPKPRMGFIVREHYCAVPEPPPGAIEQPAAEELPELPDF